MTTENLTAFWFSTLY